MTIETERLILKSPHEVTGKAVSCYYAQNREFLKEFLSIQDDSFYSEEYQQKMLKNQIEDWEKQSGCRFFICLKDEPCKIIGSIALNNIVKGAFYSCFLGYQLDAEHINQGYMTEAIKRVVDFAFKVLHLHRIEGNVMPKNKASISVLKKCNFINEGTSRKYLKINGVWEDHIHYVILNDDV